MSAQTQASSHLPTYASTKKFPPSAPNPSLAFQTLRRTRQMNASHFLFTFDLPLSPQKSEKKERKRGGEMGEKSQTEGGGERKKRGKEKWGAGELLLLFSPYLLSLSPSFFFFCLLKGKLDGQSFATSSLQPVHLACYRSGFLSSGKLSCRQI